MTIKSQETFKYQFRGSEANLFESKKDNTLRITYENRKAKIIELLTTNGMVIAKADICELTSSEREVADAERISGLITNQKLFLKRLWELIQEKSVDIINESIFKFKIRKNGEVVCNKTDMNTEDYNTLKVVYINEHPSAVELLSKDGTVMTRTNICKLTSSERMLADSQRKTGFITNNQLHILRLLEMIENETADIIVA